MKKQIYFYTIFLFTLMQVSAQKLRKNFVQNEVKIAIAKGTISGSILSDKSNALIDIECSRVFCGRYKLVICEATADSTKGIWTLNEYYNDCPNSIYNVTGSMFYNNCKYSFINVALNTNYVLKIYYIHSLAGETDYDGATSLLVDGAVYRREYLLKEQPIYLTYNNRIYKRNIIIKF